MIQYEQIINKYYPEGSCLRDILLVHSRRVGEKALLIADAHPEIAVDRDFVYAAAMLHDIGIVRCDATGIECFGSEPYICHGTIGARMLREYADECGSEALFAPYGIEAFARVCMCHTGAGLTKQDIVSQNLPLPPHDLMPLTIEEKLVCYADKFFSKTHPDDEKPLDRVLKSMQKFGTESYQRFLVLHKMFG